MVVGTVHRPRASGYDGSGGECWAPALPEALCQAQRHLTKVLSAHGPCRQGALCLSAPAGGG